MAVVDYFLKIDGIKGESQADGHKDEIQLESWSFGATQGGTFAFGGGGGAGKVSFNDFHFVMKVNKSTPDLFIDCCIGKHIPSALLTCRKAAGKQETFVTWKFSDLLISSYQTSGSGSSDVIPMDQISFNFTKVEFEYFEQDAKGIMKSAGKKTYDLKAIKAS